MDIAETEAIIIANEATRQEIYNDLLSVNGLVYVSNGAIRSATKDNTISIVSAGTGIDTSVVESPVNTFTYTVTHEDTSALSGSYGTEGIKSVTVDTMGHVSSITTETYLKESTQSKDFKTIIVTDNDTGYTWLENGSLSGTIVGDTVSFVSNGGVNINIDPTAKAIQIAHANTSSQTNVAFTNSTFIQGATFDTFGHVVSLTSGTLQAIDLLNSIKTVDGTNSGLDADLLDGQHGSFYAPIDSPTFTGDVNGITSEMTGSEPANSNIQQHIIDVVNPHNTTYEQVGAEPSGAVYAHNNSLSAHGLDTTIQNIDLQFADMTKRIVAMSIALG